MRKLIYAFVLALAVNVMAEEKHDYPYQPVDFTKVKLTDKFWHPRIETNRTVTVPYAFKQSEKTGRIENFKVAGGLSDKRWTGGFGFNDSDVNKIIEGASYCLSVKPNPELDKYLDELISYYAAAQEEDGFLYTYWTAAKRAGAFPGARCRPRDNDRWSNIHEAHQLYNVGHMYEAGVAHYLATGKRSLLDICIKNADLVCKTFGPDGLKDPPGHQEIEIGLAKLYRATGDKKYIEQAKFFLEMRGRHGKKDTYNQKHKPVLEQEEAVGHAVRANYMFSGMADVAALTGDKAYIDAIDKLWENVVGKKLYITGGTGALGRGEAYGDNYFLTNYKAYCETCAAVANVYWNHRMFLLHGDAKYIDVMERSLYNNVLSGIALDGKHFFYNNKLATTKHGRKRDGWFGVACCPSNISRFLASVGGYMYAVRDASIYVNLYGQSEADIKLGKRTVKLTQESEYPWKGAVKLTVSPSKKTEFALNIRIPGWAKNQPVPSDLYTVAPGNEVKWEFSCKVNGKTVEAVPQAGYAVITRKWKEGDTVEFDLPMEAQRILSHEKVQHNVGRVALQRGPIVYCVEFPDVANKVDAVANLTLADSSKLKLEHREDLLNGMTVIASKGRFVKEEQDFDAGIETDFFMIPYYAWAHRGQGEMIVWMKRWGKK